MQGWPSIDPGRMVHRVTLLKPVVGSDLSGTKVSYVASDTVWAEIDPVSANDLLRSGQVTTQTMLTVKIYWQTGVSSDMRLQTLNGLYIIKGIENPGERNIMLILNCVAMNASR